MFSTWYQILFINYAYGNSVECPNVINLAFGLNLHLRRPTIWNQLQINCCNSTGITCAGNVLNSISWGNMGLNGTVNSTAMYFNGLQYLWLQNNKITGNLPNSFPSGFISLQMYNNKLTGTVPAYTNGVVELWIDGNQLTGDVPAIPNSMQYLTLGTSSRPGNAFTGTLRFNKPYYASIVGNYITDVIFINLSQLPASGSCDLSGNPLLGNPNLIPLVSKCVMDGLYNATSLPTTLTNTYTVTGLVDSAGINGHLSSTSIRTLVGNEPSYTSSLLFTKTSINSQSTASTALDDMGSRTANGGTTTPASSTNFISVLKMLAISISTSSQSTITELYYVTDTVTYTQGLKGPVTQLYPVLTLQKILKMLIRIGINFFVLVSVLNRAPYLRAIKELLHIKPPSQTQSAISYDLS